tara:strand:+ start:309 stop:524 length:216 start_codon:yes stop_codon:yes gene_type:complete
MKRTNNINLNLHHQTSPKGSDLNQPSIGCAPCLNEALKINRQINKRPANEIKIDEIKNIVKSIFQNLDNDS